MVLWKARRHSRRSGSGKTSVVTEWKEQDVGRARVEGHDFSRAEVEGRDFSRAEVEGHDFSRAEKARAKWALAPGVSLVPLDAPYDRPPSRLRLDPNSQPRALTRNSLRAGGG